MSAIAAIHARGRLPILVGGTGFYYRALARGIFPGPGRDDRVRGRLDAMAARRGPERLHRLLGRIDPPSAARIQPRDRMRIVRALEVYFQSGRTLTDHFADTRAPLAGGRSWASWCARRGRRSSAASAGASMPSSLEASKTRCARCWHGRAARRTAVHRLCLPARARVVRGERDRASARDLIVIENRHYARRS